MTIKTPLKSFRPRSNWLCEGFGHYPVRAGWNMGGCFQRVEGYSLFIRDLLESGVMMRQLNHAHTMARLLVGMIVGAKFLCTSAALAADWPTYGFDIAHTGNNPVETTLTAANASKLALLWSFNTQSGILTQPVLATGVPNVNGQIRDLVIIGNLNGDLSAVDAKDGSVQWTWATKPGYVTRHCSNSPGDDDLPGGRYGMIGTPVIDRSADGGAGRVYLALLGKVYAVTLNAGTPAPGWTAAGTTVVANPFNPGVPGADGLGDSFPDTTTETGIIIYSALTLNAGKLYVEFGGISCDIPPNYHGLAVAIDTATGQVTKQWFAVDPASAETGGSIWGVSGAAVDPSDGGGVFVATGNTIGGTAENNQFGEDVLKLSFDLATVLGDDDPSSGTPPLIQGADRDFGSTPILFQPQGCQNPLAAVLNKNGELLVYARDHLGDDQNFPPQLVQIGVRPADTEYSGSLIGAPAWNANLQQLYVSNNSDGSGSGGNPGGVLAFGFSNCQVNPKPIWVNTPATLGVGGGTEGAVSPPTTAADVVYFGTGISGDSRPTAYALDARPPCGATVTAGCSQKPGQVLWQSEPFTVGVFTAPTVVNGVLYVPSMDGVLRAYGVPPGSAGGGSTGGGDGSTGGGASGTNGDPAPLSLYVQATGELIDSVKADVRKMRSTLFQFLKPAYQQFSKAQRKAAANKTSAAKNAYGKAVKNLSRFQKVLTSNKAQKKIPPEIRQSLLDKVGQIIGYAEKPPL